MWLAHPKISRHRLRPKFGACFANGVKAPLKFILTRDIMPVKTSVAGNCGPAGGPDSIGHNTWRFLADIGLWLRPGEIWPHRTSGHCSAAHAPPRFRKYNCATMYIFAFIGLYKDGNIIKHAGELQTWPNSAPILADVESPRNIFQVCLTPRVLRSLGICFEEPLHAANRDRDIIADAAALLVAFPMHRAGGLGFGV